MRPAVYGAASAVVAGGVILSAFNQRANFYSACVYLAQSNACLMVLTNLLILLSIVFGHGLQLLFYGPLRAMEVEQIYEKAWYAVTETCLAMTIFRDEFDVRFIIMFGVLLFVKCFSWIGGGRVEFMEQQQPEHPVLFHVRLASSLILLCGACGGLLWHAITAVLERGKPNMMVMFAFEFAILLITSIGILSRYLLGLVEKYVLHREAIRRKEARAIEHAASRQRRREENEQRRVAGEEVEEEDEGTGEDEEDEELDVGGWEEKGTWVFYSELCTDFLKLLTYLSFFAIVLTWYGLPLHIIRDVYLTLRSFITRIRDFIRYRRATAHMNSRYPDATAEEVARENVCIICREEMQPWAEEAVGEAGRNSGTRDQRHRAKKLPCGHVLHFSCLRSWLERQQRCPTCRRPVLEETPVANGNAAPNAAPGAPGNGIAFQAQFGIGPLGLDIGVGGPGIMQNFLDRINQQNQGNQQQPAAAAAAPAQPGQQQDQQQPNPNSAASEIQQHIIRTRQLIERETAMLELSRRQLQQLQLLQAHQDAVNLNAGNAASAVPPPAQPVPAEAPLGTTPTPASGATNEGNAPPIAQPVNAPGSASSSTASFAPPSLGTSGSPQNVILPPGWSVIPLTVFAPDWSSGLATPSPLSPTALALRRNHRAYQENMRNYHSLRTPTEHSFHDVELGHRFRRPSIGRINNAPAGPRERRVILTDTSRLTPAQQVSLDRPTRECVIALSLFLDQHYVEGRREYVNTLLLGLPEEIRTEILTGWPDQQLAEQIGGNVAIMSQMNASEEMVSSAREVALRGVASMVTGLDRIERLRVLLGLPAPFRNSAIDRTEESDALRLGVEELRTTYSCTEFPELPEVTPLPEQPTPGELSRVDQETREAVSQRITALNDAAQRMREAAANLERTAATSPFFVPTPSSFADGAGGEERLRMFGEASMFPLPAQERTLRRLEEELVDKEKEFKAGKVIEGLLNGGGTGGARAREDERKEEEWTDVQSATPTAEGKGKKVERGEGSENT